MENLIYKSGISKLFVFFMVFVFTLSVITSQNVYASNYESDGGNDSDVIFGPPTNPELPGKKPIDIPAPPVAPPVIPDEPVFPAPTPRPAPRPEPTPAPVVVAPIIEPGFNSLQRTKRFSGEYDKCSTGSGYYLYVGLDKNRNSKLEDSEVTSTTYNCDGANGNNGQNGKDGKTQITTKPSKPIIQAPIAPRPTPCPPVKRKSNFNWSGFSQAALAIGGLGLTGYGMYNNHKIQQQKISLADNFFNQALQKRHGQLNAGGIFNSLGMGGGGMYGGGMMGGGMMGGGFPMMMGNGMGFNAGIGFNAGMGGGMGGGMPMTMPAPMYGSGMNGGFSGGMSGGMSGGFGTGFGGGYTGGGYSGGGSYGGNFNSGYGSGCSSGTNCQWVCPPMGGNTLMPSRGGYSGPRTPANYPGIPGGSPMGGTSGRRF